MANAVKDAVNRLPLNLSGVARQVGIEDWRLRQIIDGKASASSRVASTIAEILDGTLDEYFEEHPIRGGYRPRLTSEESTVIQHHTPSLRPEGIAV